MLTPTISTIVKPVPSSPAVARGARPGPAAVTHPFDGTIEMMGAPMSFPRNGEIYGEGEPADFVYKVVSGTVRTYKVLADGRRQIGAFHLPGDVFGLESGLTHRLAAEAIHDTTVRLVMRRALEQAAQTDVRVARDLWAITSGELRHAENHMLLLGR